MGAGGDFGDDTAVTFVLVELAVNGLGENFGGVGVACCWGVRDDGGRGFVAAGFDAEDNLGVFLCGHKIGFTGFCRVVPDYGNIIL